MGKSSAKTLIRTTVVELMETTDIPDITVTAVCKRSNLSRTTFYRYYPSVDAVVKEMGDDLLASIRRTQEIDRRTQGLGGMRKTGTSDLIRAQILYEYGPFIRVVTGVHGDPSFAYKAVAVIRERLQEEVGSLGLSQLDQDVLVEFMLAGFFRCINYWLAEHPDITPEEAYACQVSVSEALAAMLKGTQP